NQVVCKNCLSSDIETNEGQGEVICLRCGAVLEENKIVESLEFVENNNGAISMVGQFIPSSGNKSFILSWGIRESREISLQKGYVNIQKIADNLHLSSQHIEAAQRIYLMALQRNFTMGRNNSYVAASCLYTICRREKSPIMLIDFSDILQTPVKPLGKTFLKLLRLLHINVPNIDPSLFLERFAHKLNLKNDIYKVTYTGIKLIQAMTRDWISTGRRPTGLCGAALLISTRMHGIPINSNTIANIVRISNPTIIKRLSEFKNTNTAKIKASEFDSISINDIPSSTIPPCVISYNKRKLKYEIIEKNKTLSLLHSEEQFTASTKSLYDSENLTEEVYTPKILDDSSSLRNSVINTIYDDVYNDADTCNNFSFVDNHSSCNELEYCTTVSCAVSEGRDIERDKQGEEQREREMQKGAEEGRERERTDLVNNIAQKKNQESGILSNSGINLEEICNDNPEGNDIDNLALKIMNTISIEGSCDKLKINNNFAKSKAGKACSNGVTTSSTGSIGSISTTGSINEKEHDNVEREYMKQKGEEKDVDALSMKSVFSIPNTNKMSDLEYSITTSPILDKDNELNKSNITCAYSCKNFANADEIREPQNISKLHNAMNSNSCSDFTGFDGCSTTYQLDNLSRSSKTNLFEEECSNKGSELTDNNFYCSTLKETVNSELSSVLNDVDEFNYLECNNIQGKNINNTEIGCSDNIFNGLKSANNVSSALTDLSYFFENNSNCTNDQSVNFNSNSDTSIEPDDETLSDIYDSEMENIMLSEKEKEIKMLIWDDMMKNYLPHLSKQLRKKKKRNNTDNTTNGKNKMRNKQKKKVDDLQDTQSTGDSVLRALEKSDRNLSGKINYQVLKSLFSS
ncbi:transcription factor IIIb subunit, partial [Plasmodium malariae]